ncbi:Bromo adjacent homology (BAH) domain [Dillenia turbinata]|uniref:Bromo adjacent homology (BAH) domain n=1 Tax=Dillenia turbinata TaxID=194707 RepID=A0AAN8ZC63_9MAGN
MHGREGEEQRSRVRHMLPVFSSASPVDSESSSSPSDSFCKDGRKISVGDCALFKPPQDLPPFIGIIRKLTQVKEEGLKLGVNWLYRPADVKLGKGSTLEAAPNEVFYSFHKDEIPAASLLHPCKVAFLRKGVELPSGISSFVCRRVYDIESKCLWWLTDKDYINEWQEEVDQLLDKTRLEMNGAVQSGGRSPKTLNGPSTTQLKSGSDSVQNSVSSFPTQVKGKKRDRFDQCSDPVKRERFSKTDDGDSDQSRPENMLKSEIAKITEKGALVDIEGVERLVQLMRPDSAEKKIDLASRIMLVDVIAVTDRLDCLKRFVFRGLPVLDEWLQEVRRGKISDSCSPKDGNKSVEEFLLALLRALDKLPVNLHALQTCNVGKSVNHLRSHKNFEIQRKARSLVDTWKRRVEAEMNMNDAKSTSGRGVSWPASKPVSSEVSHVGNRRPGGSSEVNMKTSIVQPCSSKTPTMKPGSGESAKFASSSPNSAKSTPSLAMLSSTNSKETNSRMLIGGTSDLPLTTIKEEKSSSSSQSLTNSQSCSSDHVKAAGSSCKEDARSSTAGSMSTNKTTSGASRSRKSTNGHLGSPGPGVQKEVGFGKFSCHGKNVTSEKVSSPGTCERMGEVPLVDQVNSPRLIVRLPNTGRSPARTASVGSFEDSAITFGRTSPAHSEKHDQHERKSKGKIDASRASPAVNLEPCQEKVGIERSDLSDRSLAEERNMTGEDGEKPFEASKSKITPESGKSFEPSLSSMNALIESCAKFSEASASTSAGDDIGMNLLATVAAGEMSKSNLSSSSGSSRRSLPDPDDSCSGNDANARHSDEGSSKECQPIDGCAGAISQGRTDGNPQLRDGSQNSSMPVPSGFGESKTALSDTLDKTEQSLEQSSRHLQQNMEGSCRTSEEKGGNPANVASATASSVEERKAEVDGADTIHEQKTSDFSKVNGYAGPYTKSKVRGGLFNEDKVVGNADENSVEDGTMTVCVTDVKSAIVEKEALEVSPSCSSSDVGLKHSKYVNVGSSNGLLSEQKPSPLGKVHLDSLPVKNDDSVALNSSAGNTDDDVKVGSHTENHEKQVLDCSSSVSETKIEKAKEDSGRKEVGSHSDARSDMEVLHVLKDSEQCIRFAGSKSGLLEADGGENASSAFLGGSNLAGKLDFDLNEGLPVEEGSLVELVKSAAPSISSTIHLPCPMPFPTVAAAAKRAFVPPENLLRTKVELGWKGSAATSAFRPAEPRKVLEMPLNAPDILLANNQSGKQSRPPLDIDLNVPDERALEDLTPRVSSQATCSESFIRDRNSGVLNLDLNKVDDDPDVGQFSIGRLDATLQGRPSISGGFPTGEGSCSRGFDLNDGPGVDDAGPEPAPCFQHAKNNMPFLSSVSGVRMNSAELRNFSSWPPQGSSYSTIAIPSVLPARGEQSYPVVATSGSQRIFGPPGGSTSFGPEIYRGPVLSSSPAVPFPPAASFQYSGYPFETNFPLPSKSFSGCSTPYMDSSSGGPLCFPSIPPQLVGPAGVVPSHFPRPYVMNIHSNVNGTTESRKWGSQGLDLNAGPGVIDIEQRDERMPPALRQLSVTSSQALAEEQLKMYQMAGGVWKRKEPDGGWDADRSSYKLPSWQ